MTPRWRNHLVELLERERDVDAVVVFTVPMSHLRGIPTLLRERFGVPVVFYDGDVPMSLPEFGGHDTGFNYYFGADPSEYDLVVSNSEGGLDRLLELGARRAEAVFWGADPELFQPHAVEKETDVFFYGYGDKFRQEWTEAMIGEPSRRLGRGLLARRPRLPGRHRPSAPRRRRPVQRLLARDLGGADQPERHAARARLRARLVHVAAVRAGDVRGDDRLESRTTASSAGSSPGRELLVVENADQATDAYARLLDDPGRRRRRWAAPPASARSTSTPSSTGHGGCSTCSVSAFRRRSVAEVATETRLPTRAPARSQADRDRPRLQRGGEHPDGDRRDPRLRP